MEPLAPLDKSDHPLISFELKTAMEEMAPKPKMQRCVAASNAAILTTTAADIDWPLLCEITTNEELWLALKSRLQALTEVAISLKSPLKKGSKTKMLRGVSISASNMPLPALSTGNKEKGFSI